MDGRDYRKIFGGGLLVAIGIFVAAYASTHYSLGTLNRMGPGMFPAMLGYLQAGLGLIILVPALFIKSGERLPKLEVRSLVAILGATAAFAITIVPFGMVPAVLLTTVIAVFADNKLGIVGTLILAGGLAALAALIFKFALGSPINLFDWPF